MYTKVKFTTRKAVNIVSWLNEHCHIIRKCVFLFSHTYIRSSVKESEIKNNIFINILLVMIYVQIPIDS